MCLGSALGTACLISACKPSANRYHHCHLHFGDGETEILRDRDLLRAPQELVADLGLRAWGSRKIAMLSLVINIHYVLV